MDILTLKGMPERMYFKLNLMKSVSLAPSFQKIWCLLEFRFLNGIRVFYSSQQNDLLSNSVKLTSHHPFQQVWIHFGRKMKSIISSSRQCIYMIIIIFAYIQIIAAIFKQSQRIHSDKWTVNNKLEMYIAHAWNWNDLQLHSKNREIEIEKSKNNK